MIVLLILVSLIFILLLYLSVMSMGYAHIARKAKYSNDYIGKFIYNILLNISPKYSWSKIRNVFIMLTLVVGYILFTLIKIIH